MNALAGKVAALAALASMVLLSLTEIVPNSFARSVFAISSPITATISASMFSAQYLRSRPITAMMVTIFGVAILSFNYAMSAAGDAALRGDQGASFSEVVPVAIIIIGGPCLLLGLLVTAICLDYLPFKREKRTVS